MNKDERTIEIDLFQLLGKLWENLKYIVIAVVAFAVLGYVGSEFILTPVYEASAKMIVNTRKDENQNVTNDQLNSAKSLVDTYAVIIRSRDVLNRVIGELDLQEGYGQLVSRISVKAVNNTQIMQVSVQYENRDTALAIATKILEIAPSVILETVEAGSVKPVEQAHIGLQPVSPNIPKNIIAMAMLGFVLSCGIIIIVYLADNTYKTDMDIQRDFEMPVLGVIPTVESCQGKKEYGHSDKGRKESV